MSHEATNWAVKARGLKPITKIVLWHLADCHNPAAGCFPTQDYLASNAEISRASVNRQLDELENLGLIRRHPRIDPETKRQLPTLYRLAFEEGFEPLDVETRVSELDTEQTDDPCLENEESRVSDSEVSVSHSYETLTSKGTGKLTSNNSPQPPSGGPRFASLWEGWPDEDRGNRENAEGSWDRLDLKAKAAAVALAPTFLSAYGKRGARTPALVTYIRHKLFEEFEGAPPLDSDGRFEVTPGCSEWNEWLGWIRSTYGAKAVENTVKLGVFRPLTRHPPKIAA